jgi:drug/metabolite transporter (DMT)-like permease
MTPLVDEFPAVLAVLFPLVEAPVPLAELTSFGEGLHLAGQGELAALSAAVIWAVASVVYTGVGRHMSPALLNLAKGLVAVGLLGLSLGLRGLGPDSVAQLPGWSVGLLLLSGVIGIGLGDTAYFYGLNWIGPRRTLVLESLSPVLTALFAWGALGERLSLGAIAGIGLTLGGVVWVTLERVPPDGGSPDPVQLTSEVSSKTTALTRTALTRTALTQTALTRTALTRTEWAGLGCATLAGVGQAVGAVLSRAALSQTSIDPQWSTLLRLLGGLGCIALGLLWQRGWQRGWQQNLSALRSPRLLVTIAITGSFSTFLAIWLQQVALKYSAAGIAQALSATSPLWVLPLVMAQGEPVTRRSLFGVLIALAGIALLVG